MNKKDNLNRRLLNSAETLTMETYARVLKQWVQNLGYLSVMTAIPGIAAAGPEPDGAIPRAPNITDRPTPTNRARRTLAARGKFIGRKDSYLLPRQAGGSGTASAFAGNDNCPGAQVPNGVYTAAAPFTDTGDTTGANNTINTVYCYYCFYITLGSNGPDHVYTFTLTSTGPNPEIRVTPNSGSYNPLIYILGGANTADPCPAAPVTRTVNVFNIANERGPGEAETFAGDNVRFLPLNVPLHLFIDSVSSTANPAGAYTLRMQDVSLVEGPRTKFDFDRDGDADISVFRPSNGTWYTSRSAAGSAGQLSGVQFGISTDQLVPADYDNDGKTDIAVFRDGTWYWINSSNSSMQAFQFGSVGDIPQPADFDGDGRSEIAVFRNGTWYTYNLRTG
ncbi:MAG TPA: VCBS repeat-containing protein, partial [Pyrinomonadaceae bacterium]|nr:VCBS repeat-containing protein [Pyrinomonadaceae bacterium]